MPSFFWYEQNPRLLEAEKTAMNRIFPQFKMDKLDDGRMYWHGDVQPLRDGTTWNLMAVYDHSHPHNHNYGGSVRIYTIEPDIDKLNRDLGGTIPHLLRDGLGNLFLCTARPEDVAPGIAQRQGQHIVTEVTSASSSLLAAIKWITVFELWLNGEVKDHEFREHVF
jgi:hypothetical protein